ncbi:hypothetical protein FISHEDRAFT_41583 [Fistulina hepatica ATCC 64428]|nr:hypothetical protein FISHEDRAFT_41583 [Fistulina hepatica ATCC 64428]
MNVLDELAPLDPAYVQETLSKPPFVQISGVLNMRDLGSYPSTAYSPRVTKPRFMFRAAELSGITDEGRSQLKQLGITTVFDLRSDLEKAKYHTPEPVIEGVCVHRTPVFREEDYSPEIRTQRFDLYASGKIEAFMQLYSEILEHARNAFGAVLCHVRDDPSGGFIFHCTAGKDRTGVLAAILLKLAGVDNDTIAHEYSLTRVGREPDREKIMQRLAQEPVFVRNNEAALNMFTCRRENILALLDTLDSRYGGVETYLQQHVGLSPEDITKIRENILCLP